MEHYKKINKELIMMNQELKIQLHCVQTELLHVRHQLLMEHSERVHNERNIKKIMTKTFRRALSALESDSRKWLHMLLDTDEDENEDDETNAERTQSLQQQQHRQSNTQQILHTLRQSHSLSRRSSIVTSPSRRFSERHSSGSILSVGDMSSSNRLNESLDPEMAPQQLSPTQTDVPQTEEEEEEEDDANEQDELLNRIPSLIQEEDENCDDGDELPDELPAMTVANRQMHNSQHDRRRSPARAPSPASSDCSDSECSDFCNSTSYDDVAMTLTPTHEPSAHNPMRCCSPLHDISNQQRHVDAGVDKSPRANHSPRIEMRRGKRRTLRKNIENARGAECMSLQLSMVEVVTQPQTTATRLSLSCGDIGATSIALSEMSISNFGQPLSSTTNESNMQKEETTTMTAQSQQQQHGRPSRKCKPQNLTEPTLNVKMRNDEGVSKHKSTNRSNKNNKK